MGPDLSRLFMLRRTSQQRKKKEEKKQESKYPECPDRLIERDTSAEDVLEHLPIPEILQQSVDEACQKANAAQAKRGRRTNKENSRNFIHCGDGR
jgi:hypothetical protein